jgi:hypothetical protein
MKEGVARKFAKEQAVVLEIAEEMRVRAKGL